MEKFQGETGSSGDRDWARVCLNCDAPLAGPFCSRCGQRALPAHPTMRELAGDALAELFGWDGKLASTLRLLFGRPGELTRALLNGQRTKHVPPVRLYLACSVLYFVVAAAAPVPDMGAALEAGGESVPARAAAQSPGDVALAKAVSVGLAGLSAEERKAAEERIAALPGFIRPLLRTMAADPVALNRSISEAMPRALFALIPLFAVILGFFYRGRSYPDHLYFAVHLQAFVFLVLTLQTATLYTRWLTLFGVTQTVGRVWIAVYAVIAQRRIYGGSWLATVLKGGGVAALYGTLWSAISFGVALWVVRSG
jgi:hypothetical protein